jgi:hypothetical protein
MAESHSLTWLPYDLVIRKLHLSHRCPLIQVSTQLVQVLKVTLPDVMAENCQEHFLIVGTMGNLPDKVDVTVLWVLSAKILDQPKRISSRTLCRMLWAFSNFQPLATPFFSGKVDFKDSNT